MSQGSLTLSLYVSCSVGQKQKWPTAFLPCFCGFPGALAGPVLETGTGIALHLHLQHEQES